MQRARALTGEGAYLVVRVGGDLVAQLLQLLHGSRGQQVGADGQGLAEFDIGGAEGGHNVPNLNSSEDLCFSEAPTRCVPEQPAASPLVSD